MAYRWRSKYGGLIPLACEAAAIRRPNTDGMKRRNNGSFDRQGRDRHRVGRQYRRSMRAGAGESRRFGRAGRSEEHTSELQSLMRISYAVFCLKNKNKRTDRRQK